MSLALGKGQSFINQIAAGKNAPLFENFFEICEYLGVTPEEFFDRGEDDPVVRERLYREVSRRSGGDPQRFLDLLVKISPENFQAFLSMLENM